MKNACACILLAYYPLPWGYELRLLREGKPASRRDRLMVCFTWLLCTILTAIWEVIRWVFIAVMIVVLMQIAGISTAKGAEISIPRAATQYKAVLIRSAHAELGLAAPVALLAAQIHTESLWRPDVTSHVGAQGLAQFMPATAKWLPTVAPQTGEPLPFNPGWAIRAMCAYDLYLSKQVKGAASACDRWAFTLSAYNGGLGWVQRDRALANAKGHDPARYWNSVELHNAGRKASAFTENRNYPRKIFNIQSLYEEARWGPGVSCD